MNNDLDYDFCDVDNIYPESPVDILRDFGLKGNFDARFYLNFFQRSSLLNFLEAP